MICLNTTETMKFSSSLDLLVEMGGKQNHGLTICQKRLLVTSIFLLYITASLQHLHMEFS